MDIPLKVGEVRIHLKSGLPYIMPSLNLDSTLRLLQDKIARVEHYKPPASLEPPKAKAPVIPIKSKASLLGKLLQDNKVTANELIEWIEKSKSVEDIGIVMKGETRKTVKAAAKQRINELI